MKKLIYLFIAGIIALSGCDDYLDVNTDPNNPTVVTPDLILPVGQDFTARWYVSDRRVSHLGNMIMYNWSESAGFSWYDSEFQYLANSPTFYDEIFDDAYERALKQYEALEDVEEGYEAYTAIARIMKAYTYQILVDFYGDIPYTEALQRSQLANPSYDDGQIVYDSLISSLTQAIAMIEAVEAEPTSVIPDIDDVVFGGDLTSWKQFANTIKLRILTRENMVKDAAYIQAQLDIIAAEGSGFITSAVTVNPGYSNNANQQSPFYEDFGFDVNGNVTLNNDATCASDWIITYLQDRADPRISRLYEEPATGHLGVPQGIISSQDVYAPSLVSNIGPAFLIGSTQDAPLLTVAETIFNQAELALAGFTGLGDPETLYNAGVQESFDYLGAGDATAYLAQNMENVNYAASSNKLQAIITQKWIAVNGISAEQSWFDWSRTGFPTGLPISVEVPSLVRPFRLAYPASEVGQNSQNVPATPDAFTNKIFWAN